MHTDPVQPASPSDTDDTAALEKSAAQSGARMRRHFFDNYLVIILAACVLVWLIWWFIQMPSSVEDLPKAPLRQTPSPAQAPAKTQQDKPPAVQAAKPRPATSAKPTGVARKTMPAHIPTPAEQRQQAESLRESAQNHRQAGDPDSAVRDYRRALEIQQALVESYPDSYSLQEDFIDTCLQLGALAGKTPAAAEATYQQALAVARRLYASDSANSRFRGLLMAVYRQLGEFYQHQENRNAAINAYRQLTDIGAADTSSANRRLLADIYDKLGALYRKNDDRQAAVWAYYQAVTFRRASARQDADHWRAFNHSLYQLRSLQR